MIPKESNLMRHNPYDGAPEPPPLAAHVPIQPAPPTHLDVSPGDVAHNTQVLGHQVQEGHIPVHQASAHGAPTHSFAAEGAAASVAPVAPAAHAAATGAVPATIPTRATATPKPAVRFGKRETKALIGAIVLAILWIPVFSLDTVFARPPWLPGLGMTVFVIAFFACVFVCAGKERYLTKATVALLVAVIILAFVPALYSGVWLKVLNSIVLLPVCLTALLLLGGFADALWCRLAVLRSALVFAVVSMFRHWTLPFRSIGRRREGAKSTVARPVIVGLLIACGMLAIVMPLLVSADAVFGDLVARVWKEIGGMNPLDAVGKLVRVVIIAPIIFSLLYAVMRREGAAVSASTGQSVARTNPVMVVTVLIALDVVYLVFVVVQFAYLFGNVETSSMNGGYAAYARSGFFQLVAVAGVNLATILLVTRLTNAEAKGWRLAQACSLLLVGLTYVILVSAAWRMYLYVDEYGMTVLRALTVLGMAFIALCLAAAAIKAVKPSFGFFRVFFATGVTLWMCFALSGVDARIAEYNVDGYLAGRIEQVDVAYLESLSPAVMSSLDRLASERPEYGEEVAGAKRYFADIKREMPWTRWSLDYALIDASFAGSASRGQG